MVVRTDSVQTLNIVAWVLENYHAKLFVGSNHDFVLMGPDTNESDVFFRVESFDSGCSFCVELSNETSIFDCGVLVHSRTDCDSLLVHNNYAKNTHVRIDSIECLLDFLRHLINVFK